MRILFVFNEYQQRGGEEVVVQNEAQLLREHGHEVRVFQVSNHSLFSTLDVLRAAWDAPYSVRYRTVMKHVLEEFEPDVVHVHNFFPLLTPSIFDAIRSFGAKSVFTLHNYRLLCAGANLSREGQICELCIKGSPMQAVKYSCYRSSRFASFAVARMIQRHRRKKTWAQKVDRFIALSQFAKSRFALGGISGDKIFVKPNFMRDPLVDHSFPELLTEKKRKNQHVGLYVGRLSGEKGLSSLIDAWKHLKIPLRVVGDGPMLEELKQKIKGHSMSHVTLVGHKDRQEVYEEMRKATFLVVPSQCYETFSMALLEAYAHGLPVIGTRLGALAENIEETKTGLLFKVGDAEDLVEKIKKLCSNQFAIDDNYEALCVNARNKYVREFNPQSNYGMLMNVYDF